MKSGLRIGFVLIVAALPSALVAQSPESRIEAAMDRIRAVGITGELLEVRLAEGRAKGVPVSRIADAIERRASALIAASQALREISPRTELSELSAGADAVEAGIPAAVIRQVARAARSEDRPVAISVLTYLHRERNLPLDVAIRNVSAAIERGSDALRELPATAARNPGDGLGNAGRGADASDARPGGTAAAGPGRQPGGGPPSGVPGPQNRPGDPGGSGNGPPGQSGRPGADPPGRGPDGGGPPGRGPGGSGPPGRQP